MVTATVTITLNLDEDPAWLQQFMVEQGFDAADANDEPSLHDAIQQAMTGGDSLTFLRQFEDEFEPVDVVVKM